MEEIRVIDPRRTSTIVLEPRKVERITGRQWKQKLRKANLIIFIEMLLIVVLSVSLYIALPESNSYQDDGETADTQYNSSHILEMEHMIIDE